MKTEIQHTVVILDTGEQYLCNGTESLLNAMVRLGRKGIPSGCHGGGCGVCKVHVTAGQYQCSAMSREHVTEDEENRGIVLACRTIPRSNVKLKVVGKMRKNIRKERKYGFV